MQARHLAALEDGRTLVQNREAKIALVDPFLLAAYSHGDSLELGIRRVTAFAFLLSAIVGAILLLGLAPRPLALIVGLWLLAATYARIFAARRRHQHGSVLVDFEAGTCTAHTLAGDRIETELANVRLVTERSADEQAPVWLLIATPRTILRLGRASVADAERVLSAFRRYHVRVELGHEQN